MQISHREAISLEARQDRFVPQLWCYALQFGAVGGQRYLRAIRAAWCVVGFSGARCVYLPTGVHIFLQDKRCTHARAQVYIRACPAHCGHAARRLIKGRGAAAISTLQGACK